MGRLQINFLLFILLPMGSVWGALPTSLPRRDPQVGLTSPQRSSANSRVSVLNAMGLPRESRLKILKKLGSRSSMELQKLAFDSQQTLHTRWRALTTLAELSPKGAEKPLAKAARSKEWFMRNAALIGMKYGNRTKAIDWAERLLNDKALLVRTAAVERLTELQARSSSPLLWKKLYSPENYRKGQSLWVRKYIVRALSQFARRGEERHFLRILRDKDERLHPFAVEALEKITGKTLGKEEDPLAQRRQRWLALAGSLM